MVAFSREEGSVDGKRIRILSPGKYGAVKGEGENLDGDCREAKLGAVVGIAKWKQNGIGRNSTIVQNEGQGVGNGSVG